MPAEGHGHLRWLVEFLAPAKWIGSVDREALAALIEERDELAEQLAAARRLAEGLFQMVPRDVWRDSGGDDGQGHYEGEYRAEGIAEEIRSWGQRGASAGGGE